MLSFSLYDIWVGFDEVSIRHPFIILFSYMFYWIGVFGRLFLILSLAFLRYYFYPALQCY